VIDIGEEELFKANGHHIQIQKIKLDADTGKTVEFLNPTIAATLLKTYLRELPEALLAEMRCWFFELASEESSEKNESIKLYRAVVSNLPSLQKEMLMELMRFFSNITKPRNGVANKISPRSIGTTFGVHLFYGKGDAEPSDLQLINIATEYMINHFDEIFLDSPA